MEDLRKATGREADIDESSKFPLLYKQLKLAGLVREQKPIPENEKLRLTSTFQDIQQFISTITQSGHEELSPGYLVPIANAIVLELRSLGFTVHIYETSTLPSDVKDDADQFFLCSDVNVGRSKVRIRLGVHHNGNMYLQVCLMDPQSNTDPTKVRFTKLAGGHSVE